MKGKRALEQIAKLLGVELPPERLSVFNREGVCPYCGEPLHPGCNPFYGHYPCWEKWQVDLWKVGCGGG